MKPRAFSLLESLVVLALVVIFARMASVSMVGTHEAARADASAHAITRALAFARNVAVVESAPVTLCPGDHGGCAGRDQWHLGSLVFVDVDGDGQLGAGERLLRRFTGWRHAGRVSWRAFRSRTFLQFTPHGFTDWQNGSFVYCPASGNLRHARRIVLNAAGRSYRAHDKDGDGIDEGPSGGPLRC